MTHRCSAMLIFSLAAGLCAADEIGDRRNRQAAVRADTELLARRIGVMLRVMDHYKLDESAERRLLEGAVATLDGLSREQMTAVIDKLDAAAAAADRDSARRYLDEAYSVHRDAVRRLRGLLAEFDSFRTLDESRVRLNRSAIAHLELSFRLADILTDSVESLRENAARRTQRNTEFPTVRAMREAEEQHDQRTEVEVTLRQIAALTVTLPDGDRELAKRVCDRAVSTGLLNRLADLPGWVKSDGGIPQRQADWRRAVDAQWQIAVELQALAAEFAPPRDRLRHLRETRIRLAVVLAQYGEACRATSDLIGRPIDDQFAPSRLLADGLGRLAFTLSELKAMPANSAPQIEASLDRAIVSIRGAADALRRQAIVPARVCQAWAGVQLQSAIREFDVAVAMAEQERRDPLAAFDAALARIDKLITEQSRLRDQSEASRADAQRLQSLSPPQRQLARSGEELARTPLPTAEVVGKLLRDAAADMHAAADLLSTKEADSSLSRQLSAVGRLRAAQLHLTRDRANVVKRRHELATLSEAKKALGEIAEAERRIAESAAAANVDARSLAAEQAKLKAPTDKVARELQAVATEAAQAAGAAATDMDSAAAHLQQGRRSEGGKDARTASEKLAAAQAQVTKALRHRQAQEAVDQAKLRPNDVDAVQAAREVAKALNSASDAAKNSQSAATSPLTVHLAQLQQEVADGALRIGNSAAATPAGQAATQISRGALRDAVRNQQSVLEQLKREVQPKAATVELVTRQQSILDTTRFLLKAHEQNEMAQAAVEQAMSQAPDAVKRELADAARELRNAGKDLIESRPRQAGAAQQSASQSLDEALAALKEAADQWAKEQKPSKATKPPSHRRPLPSGDTRESPGDRTEAAVSSGDKPSDGFSQDKTVRRGDAAGEGSFVNLQPRQRELIRQAITDKLPAEYAAAIQQYYVNIARGKPATKPASTPRAEKK